MALVPASMHDAQARQVQPQREYFEPVDDFSVACRLVLQLGQESLVLVLVFAPLIPAVQSQEFVRFVRVRSV